MAKIHHSPDEIRERSQHVQEQRGVLIQNASRLLVLFLSHTSWKAAKQGSLELQIIPKFLKEKGKLSYQFTVRVWEKFGFERIYYRKRVVCDCTILALDEGVVFIKYEDGLAPASGRLLSYTDICDWWATEILSAQKLRQVLVDEVNNREMRGSFNKRVQTTIEAAYHSVLDVQSRPSKKRHLLFSEVEFTDTKAIDGKYKFTCRILSRRRFFFGIVEIVSTKRELLVSVSGLCALVVRDLVSRKYVAGSNLGGTIQLRAYAKWFTKITRKLL